MCRRHQSNGSSVKGTNVLSISTGTNRKEIVEYVIHKSHSPTAPAHDTNNLNSSSGSGSSTSTSSDDKHEQPTHRKAKQSQFAIKKMRYAQSRSPRVIRRRKNKRNAVTMPNKLGIISADKKRIKMCSQSTQKTNKTIKYDAQPHHERVHGHEDNEQILGCVRRYGEQRKARIERLSDADMKNYRGCRIIQKQEAPRTNISLHSPY
eukprot:195752_1